ncbi:DUF4336 domain-containing protein [Sphingomonas antarctica]|uniref:DUF4336 domain-containing protein n=1 Tax=Sphingomonas antarctica TaxID=2040274 RepID=UPI0039EA78BE
MPKFNDKWVVQPHGPLIELDRGLWTVEGEIVMPLGRFPRRMTVVALSDGRLLIWSPVPVDRATLQAIEAKGRIAFLIVPGIGHRLDIRAWASRFAKAQVLSPPGAREAVGEAVPVTATIDILGDPDVSFAAADGTDGKEGVLRVIRDGRLTLVVNDILANVRHPHGLGAKIMARLFGFGISRPRMPRPAKRMFVKDGRALAAQMRGWAADPALTRIVVSHGDVIEDDCAAVFERAAADFD